MRRFEWGVSLLGLAGCVVIGCSSRAATPTAGENASGALTVQPALGEGLLSCRGTRTSSVHRASGQPDETTVDLDSTDKIYFSIASSPAPTSARVVVELRIESAFPASPHLTDPEDVVHQLTCLSEDTACHTASLERLTHTLTMNGQEQNGTFTGNYQDEADSRSSHGVAEAKLTATSDSAAFSLTVSKSQTVGEATYRYVATCTGQVGAPKACKPDCSKRACGDDGCGGSCGSCNSGQACSDGSCRPLCGEVACGGDTATCCACSSIPRCIAVPTGMRCVDMGCSDP